MKKTITALVAAVLLTQAFIPQAEAASKGWRYWGYYQAAAKSTTWKAAMTGPTVDIADGSVEGWIFTFSSDDIPSTPPSIKPNFQSICGKTKAQAGLKRVGLVIDFGELHMRQEVRKFRRQSFAAFSQLRIRKASMSWLKKLKFARQIQV